MLISHVGVIIMRYQAGPKIFLFSLILSLYIFIGSGSAESFPFRTIAPGDKLPDITVTTEDGQTLSTKTLQGVPFILFFWGADIAAKKERSIKALSEISTLTPFLQNKGIKIIIIDAQGDNPATVAKVKEGSGINATFYHDPNQQAYEKLGIFIMPSLLLLNKEGKIVKGIGYSRTMVQRLQGEIEILLGEKTTAELERELHPQTIEKDPTEKKAHRHLQMGIVLEKKGQIEAAIREFQQALALQNNLSAAQAELGCGLLQTGKDKEADEALNTALDLDQNSLRAEICLAQLNAKQGEIAEAIDDLRTLLFRHSRDSSLHYALGQLYLQQKNHPQAAQEFGKAYELLKEKINLHGK